MRTAADDAAGCRPGIRGLGLFHPLLKSVGPRAYRFLHAAGEADLCGAVGGDCDLIGGFAVFPLPAALYRAVHAVIGQACMGEPSAGAGGDGKMVFPVYPVTTCQQFLNQVYRLFTFNTKVKAGNLLSDSQPCCF